MFRVVHEIGVHEKIDLNNSRLGRMRVRAVRILPASIHLSIAEEIANLPKIHAVEANVNTGSILFFYEDLASRMEALKILARVALPNADADNLPVSIDKTESDNVVVGALFSVARYFVGKLLPMPVRMALCTLSALPFFIKGLKSLFNFKFNVELLDATAIATAMLTRDFNTASTLMLLLHLGETLESWTKSNSRLSLAQSLALNIDNVWLQTTDGQEVQVPLVQVQVNDLVIVRAGASIPVDGIVISGLAVVNQASMTGEPLGVKRGEGSAVFAGTVVEEGEITIKVSQVGKQTRISQIIDFIEESEILKAGIQGRSERLADMAVPFTFGLATLVWLFTRNTMLVASVLLVDYSCALKLATPLAVLAAMRDGVNNGVLVKGGRYLEALTEVDAVVFDKTGTLTNASPKVVEVVPVPGQNREEVLRIMACLEEHFPHPVARAVVRKAQEENLQHEEKHAKVEYIVAHGVASSLEGRKLCVGSRHYIENDEGVDLSALVDVIERETALGRSLLYLAEDGKLAGLLAIEDPLRDEATEVVKTLEAEGLQVYMLTGDDQRTAKAMATKAGIVNFKAQVLPTDKVNFVQDLAKKGAKVLMVGDGINDAPALSAAHVGIAMLDSTDLAREVSNVVLTTPNLNGLLFARNLAKSSLQRIHFNFGTTILLNSLFLLGGLTGLLQPGISAILHNLTTLGVSLNALRPHKNCLN